MGHSEAIKTVSFSDWVLAARPKTLWVAVAPVIIASSLAVGEGGFHFLAALGCVLMALLIQIATNFCNDYCDFVKGTDQPDRIGPQRATAAGLISPQKMKRAVFLVFSLALGVGALLSLRGGTVMMFIAIFSVLSGVWYSAGRFSLSDTGLADLFVLLFFGPVEVGATFYVQTLELPLYVLLAGFAPGLLATSVLAVNNLRDVHQDRRAGRKTLAVRFGAAFVRFEYVFCLLGALGIPPLLCYLKPGHSFALLSSLVLLMAVPLLKAVFNQETDGPTFNGVLGGTAKNLLIYSLLFSLGWML